MSNPFQLLIVEDESIVRGLLNDLLVREGYIILTAINGHEAIEHINQSTIDLILLDIGLPDVNGFQIMDHIGSKSSDIPTIVLTGEVSLESAVTALRKGAYDYIQKPFKNAELITTVKNALNYKKVESDRKDLTKKLRKHNEFLEHLVAKRTIELKKTNEKLHRELSEWIRWEEELLDSKERFRNVFENSLIGIAIIQNNRIVFQNLEQKKLYNASFEETLLQDLKNIHPEDLAKVKAAYKSIMINEVQSTETDFRFYPSGRVGNERDLKWVHCRATRFKYQGEDAILLNALDVTKTKKLEHQLIIRNKMLSLERVAAGIAHEIRNPLTGINSYLYTLDEMCCSETIETEDVQLMRHIINQIQTASDKITLVIKRLMDFSKPGAPKMVLTNLNESI